MYKFKWWLLTLLLIKACLATDFLPAWQAFQVKAQAGSNNYLWVKFDIAPEYHIYQNKIRITALPDSHVAIGQPLLPDPQVLVSSDLGSFKVYEGKTAIQVPITNFNDGQLKLQVNYQGCKGLDMCFPEQAVKLDIDLQTGASTPIQDKIIAVTTPAADISAEKISKDGIISYFQRSIPLIILSFFVLGLLIAFTPCVFPLLPVLIGVIAGKNISTQRSFALALSYIIGGAATYAFAGVAAASLGYSISGYLQAVWLNALLAILFAGFGVALLVNFNFQLPLSWQNRLNSVISQQKPRSLLSAFVIGGISNLVLSPCVTAPLAGALLYITSTGNTLLGGSALFALGLGSGIPLLVIAVFGRKFLPKSGNWMNLVKKILALVLLGVAVYQLSKIISLQSTILLALVWAIFSGGIILRQLLAAYHQSIRWGAIVVLTLTVCTALLVSNSLGDLLKNNTDKQFVVVTTPEQLNHYLLHAQAKHQPVVIDFYAQWCVACKEMDIKTFSNQQVNDLMKNYLPIRIDVSSNDKNAQQLLAQYQIIAPPSMVFIGANGEVMKKYQVNGFIAGNELSDSLKQVLNDSEISYRQCTNDNKC